MKPWMRILMWFGLGTALGYCAGKQVGYTKAKREDENLVNNAYERGKADLFKDTTQEFDEIASQYRIENPDIQQPATYVGHRATNTESAMIDTQYYPDVDDDRLARLADIPRQIEMAQRAAKRWEPDPDPDDEPDMPMDEPAIDDLDNLEAGYVTTMDDPNDPDVSNIQPFHPTFIVPRIVSEEEYDNCGDLDEKTLIYYEGDEVLYCVEDQKPIGEDEQPALIGIGTLEAFRAGPGEPKDELYVVNETYGRFKIFRMDDAFADAVDGTCAPDDEDDDDD